MASENLDGRPRAKSENLAGCKPRSDVITAKTVHGDTLYLIRLREDWDTLHTFHVKKLSEFKELDKALRESDKAAVAAGEERVITVLPDMPEEGRFGLRRQLSKIGMSGFLDRQHQAVQGYMDTIMSQIPGMQADRNLQLFFAGAKDPEQEELLQRWVVEVRSGINLSSMAGNWKPCGYDHTWTIEESGKAMLDGVHRGTEYDLTESGQGLELAISRLDGWKVDIEKSSINHLFWYMPGQADLEWVREGSEAAAAEVASPKSGAGTPKA